MAELGVKLSIEKTIHDSITSTLQQISDTYHLQVLDIDVDWLDVSTQSDMKHIIKSLKIKTHSACKGEAG